MKGHIPWNRFIELSYNNIFLLLANWTLTLLYEGPYSMKSSYRTVLTCFYCWPKGHYSSIHEGPYSMKPSLYGTVFPYLFVFGQHDINQTKFRPVLHKAVLWNRETGPWAVPIQSQWRFKILKNGWFWKFISIFA